MQLQNRDLLLDENSGENSELNQWLATLMAPDEFGTPLDTELLESPQDSRRTGSLQGPAKDSLGPDTNRNMHFHGSVRWVYW